jgi:hypothetical protein
VNQERPTLASYWVGTDAALRTLAAKSDEAYDVTSKTTKDVACYAGRRQGRNVFGLGQPKQLPIPFFRQIRLSIESGGTAYIAFPKERPTDWLQFVGSATNLYMTQDEFVGVYHLIQSESPVFFTALNLFGFAVGAVHTELDLSVGEIPGEGEEDPHSLEALIRLAKRQESGAIAHALHEHVAGMMGRRS